MQYNVKHKLFTDLDDAQKNLQLSSNYYNMHSHKISSIFSELRRILNINHNDTGNISEKTLDI